MTQNYTGEVALTIMVRQGGGSHSDSVHKEMH